MMTKAASYLHLSSHFYHIHLMEPVIAEVCTTGQTLEITGFTRLPLIENVKLWGHIL